MKECEDCGASSPDEAVTCSECGALFVDQIGVAMDRPSAFDDVDDLDEQELQTPEPSSMLPGSHAVSVCRGCGTMGSAGQRRCVSCGSNQISIQLVSSAEQKSGNRPSLGAWDRRPDVGVLDVAGSDITSEFAYVYFAIGVFKLLLGSLLAGMLVFGRIGPGGLQYSTYVWRYPLSITLFLGAFTGAFGGYSLLSAKRSGAALLSLSFALDVLLLGWLVFHIVTGRIFVWPDSGPYIFLTCVCVYLSVDSARRARRRG